MGKRFMIKNKKGMEMEMLGWWILAIAVLVITLLGYFILSGKGIDAIDYLKNLFKFGR